jgi:short-subunit dehydrogenase
MKKAIIIGASSGIGRSLAKKLSQKGYTLGLASRREALLLQLQKELKTACFIKKIDIADLEKSKKALQELIREMKGVDLIILNAGISFRNLSLAWEKEQKVIETNVLGFCHMAVFSMNYFFQKGEGHLVGISSVAAIRGNFAAPAYHASKAFISNYLESLRQKAYQEKKPVFVTEIRPGFVKTALEQGSNRFFWAASPEVAARQIVRAIEKKKSIAYVTRRWKLIGFFMEILPEKFYQKIMN